MDNSFFNQKPQKRWLIIFIAVIFVILAITVAEGLYVFEKRYDGKIAPGVKLKGFSLAGLPTEKVSDVIDRQLDEATAAGFRIVSKEKTFRLTPVVSSETNPELSLRLINFDSDKMAAEAYEYGHDANFIKSLAKKLALLARPVEIKPIYSVNKEILKKILKENFYSLEQEPKDAEMVFDKNFKAQITEGQEGMTIDYDVLIDKIKGRLDNLDLTTIAIYPKITEPKIWARDAASGLAEAEQIISLAPISVTYGEDKYTLSKKTLAEALALYKIGDRTIVIFDRNNFDKYLDKIASYIEVSPQEPKLALSDGHIAEFTPPRAGLKIDRDANYGIFTKTVLREKKNTLELVVEKILPKTNVGDINNLGITEIVGTGVTSFVGSPKNRVANIGVGVKKLSGLVIQPGEEFSVISALKPIDKASGYLPELVIKKDKTIPEFGGGLCQIGTTMFRVALDAGLPILKRQNHSYRVPYYEPPVGMDATIYDPAPDVVFKNNYPTAILLQGYVRGTKLTFELWGTKDGRQVDITKPVVYNTTAPPPKREVQTEDLAVGQIKCTERAHAGADAKFIYTVTLTDGTASSKEFKSHYIPWGEVCLIGVPKGTLASSTPSAVQ